MFLILLLITFIIVMIFFNNKISIDLNSFFRKSLPLDRSTFGVYCFTGKQGTGKTYSLTKYVKKHLTDDVTAVYSNVTIKGIDYIPIESVEHLLSLRDEQKVFIIYDEIFTLLSKQTRITEELMEFLTQQRKMKNIFFTTAQEWLEIPITFRRFVRIQIECETFPLGKFGGILFERYYNAAKMKWDNLENEYVAPLISSKISKYEKRFMLSYDTYERIRKLK